MPTQPETFWSSCGHDRLSSDARGWLVPTADYWHLWLERPELALVEESCDAERALHEALQHDPLRAVPRAELDALADDDVRANHRLFLDFRDAVMAAGSLEAAYAGFFKQGSIVVPPLFLDLMVQAIVSHLLADEADPLCWRAAEMLFRRQRVSVSEGRVLSGDADTLDMLNETGGAGAVGRLLLQGGAALPAVQVEVLAEANGARYMESRLGAGRFNFVLDLTHEVQNELPHGLTLTMTRSNSGLKALARVLQRWVRHFLGTGVQIRPEARVDDPSWRWHLGLDVESSRLLNDLYQGHAVEPERQARLISLFRLQFDDPAHVLPEMHGKPVYLGMAMTEGGLLKLKPQNLLLNLPLANRS
ncbi:hypothetical protein J2W49_004320 [Hydrogenophaga palleronii]|uniref:Uncharacterized protein n=1 Tax=Hydrogenophaga palleronii TaxID=65655 RepID=A0ABU1WSQ9_9BURK|nr:DUF6352 family protein [Hydrogenophaga palleronii]MDR7152344.1 hypothetical protein [Hydrogenophaga palleronii]